MAFAVDDERSHNIRAAHAFVVRLFLPLVNRDSRAVGQFVAEQPEGLFADRFRSQKARRLVRIEVRIKVRNAFGEKLFDFAQQIVELTVLFSRHRHNGGEGIAAHRISHQRQKRVAVLREIGLAHRQNDVGRFRREQPKHFKIARLPAV